MIHARPLLRCHGQCHKHMSEGKYIDLIIDKERKKRMSISEIPVSAMR